MPQCTYTTAPISHGVHYAYCNAQQPDDAGYWSISATVHTCQKKTAQFPKETNPLTFHGSNLKNHSPNHQRHTFGNHLIHIAPFLASDHGPTGPANDPQCLQQGKYTSPPSASTCLLATPCPHSTTWHHASTNFP
jgi:hypothetical protein